MFDIDYLIIPEIQRNIDDEQKIEVKTKILTDLIEFERKFSDYKEKISNLWYENMGEQYDTQQHMLVKDDINFILEYAKKTNDLGKVKHLINRLCSLSDEVEDYDTIIAEANNETSLVADISKFEFTDSTVKPKSIGTVNLSYWKNLKTK